MAAEFFGKRKQFATKIGLGLWLAGKISVD
jgi:hypothetical protein